jgi:hypothetical protein
MPDSAYGKLCAAFIVLISGSQSSGFSAGAKSVVLTSYVAIGEKKSKPRSRFSQSHIGSKPLKSMSVKSIGLQFWAVSIPVLPQSNEPKASGMLEDVSRMDTSLYGEVFSSEPELSLGWDWETSDPMLASSGDTACKYSLSSEDKVSFAVNLPSMVEHIAPVFVTLLSCPIKLNAKPMASTTFSRCGRLRVLSRIRAEHRKDAVSKIIKDAK